MKLTSKITLKILIFVLTFGTQVESTFLKNKEIVQLQQQITDLNAKSSQVPKVCSTECPCTKAVKEQIELLTERFHVFEFKLQTLTGPKSPGSIQRRPGIKRGKSTDSRLSPYDSHRGDDYFSATTS